SDQALAQFVAEETPNEAEKLHRLIGRQVRLFSRHTFAQLSEGRAASFGCRALAQRRLHPNAAALHLDDLIGDGEPEARAGGVRVRPELVPCSVCTRRPMISRRAVNCQTKIFRSPWSVVVSAHTHDGRGRASCRSP